MVIGTVLPPEQQGKYELVFEREFGRTSGFTLTFFALLKDLRPSPIGAVQAKTEACCKRWPA